MDFFLNPFNVGVCVSVVVVGASLGRYWYQRRMEEKTRDAPAKETLPQGEKKGEGEGAVVHILYATQKGTTRKFAEQAAFALEKIGFKPKVFNVAEYEVDQLSVQSWVLFIVSTYTDGQPPDSARAFCDWLCDTSVDHRVPKTFFKEVRYAVFGCGNGLYEKNFNVVARNVDEWMKAKSARRLVPVGLGDVDKGNMPEVFSSWCSSLARALKKDKKQMELKEAAKRKQKAIQEAEESMSEEEDPENEMFDVEDVGNSLAPGGEGNVVESKAPTKLEDMTKEMLTPVLRKELTKQGYQLIGSHSGVKLCRWTKNMLRGRGGCYKHSFYGISSFQCMEMTPSLACANKCVFCWRHHTNPVTKEWRWKVDEPKFLIDEAIKNHRKMINAARGIQGVLKERIDEGMNIKHCALSLVGEPIIYPYINQFVDLLHENEISSFLVTNAQFPEKILSMKPVTQLYISIDAANPESLKAIDRPLFSDFWERHVASIDALAKYPQRTVHRLTLVKEHNMEEVQDYAKLVLRGLPDFVEVKGVTYCGKSDASNLTIKNTPFHDEVISFCKNLVQVVNDMIQQSNQQAALYDISCEHEHSLCVLITNKKKFFVEGK
eukprot:TRINITY_DN8410_c2_g1_i2.p1 TRINITY_DN8410_c2_g1~~TRINITY_DN8410_c2_g1_i2.p1  ORF type:complete len:604 (-),score=135.01 TRINITY_DN8410_c2_g1_i2:88-1899(-)